jgi:hypothetical protein
MSLRITKVALVAVVALAALSLGTRRASAQGYYGGGYGGGGGGWWAYHNGLTFEANIGLGYLNERSGGQSYNDFGLSFPDLGIGGFLTPQLALTLREANMSYSDDFADGSSVSVTSIFIGPSLQFWVNPIFWLGGGVGFAVAHSFTGDGNGDFGFGTDNGFGLDLRAGVTFGRQWRRSFNASIEVTPSFYGDYTLTGVALEFGYQFL